MKNLPVFRFHIQPQAARLPCLPGIRLLVWLQRSFADSGAMGAVRLLRMVRVEAVTPLASAALFVLVRWWMVNLPAVNVNGHARKWPRKGFLLAPSICSV